MKHRSILGSASAALALIVAACGGATATPASSQPKDKVMFTMVAANILNLPYVVAKDQGFFDKHNIDADRFISKGGAEALAALAGRSADLTYSTVQQVAQSNDQGLPLRIVAGDIVDIPYILIARNDLPTPHLASGYPSVMHDLKGKKISVTSRGGDLDLKLRALLKGAGMDPEKDVTIVQGGADMATGLLAGQWDAMIYVEPTISQLVVERKAAKVILDMRKGDGPSDLRGSAYNGWTATKATASEGRIGRAAQALGEASTWMNNPANAEKLQAIVSREIPSVSPAVIKAFIESSVKSFRGQMTQAEVDKALAPLNDGVLKSKQTYADIVQPKSVAAGSK